MGALAPPELETYRFLNLVLPEQLLFFAIPIGREE